MIFSKILIIDDELGIREQLTKWLNYEGYKTEQAVSGQEALEKMRKTNFTVILLDLELPDMKGLVLLQRLHKEYPDVCVIVLTGHGSEESLAQARQAGAFDFFEKPPQFPTLISRIDAAIAQYRLQRELYYQQEEAKQQYQFENIVGACTVMRHLFDLIRKVAQSEEAVLLQGESGTGKDLVAGAIHYNSPRKDKPFILADCGALTDTLAEAELFGHEKGAFSGAEARKSGKFERAHQGTLFIDEIGDLSPPLQLKFLQFLQHGTFELLGGEDVTRVDVRVIAATNVSMAEAVGQKKFRQDLFSRLNRVPIYVPSLHERREDIPLLVRHFITKFNRRNGRAIADISPAALELLMGQHFPGNVRDLENIVARAVVFEESDLIKPETIRMWLGSTADDREPDYTTLSYKEAKELFERQYFSRLLQYCNNNVSKTAETAGMDRSHVTNKLKTLGLRNLEG